ncbi:ABC-type uncharacterized transporter OS=Singulisphaera acidiphila (strain ATCC BAA-1392 / DSM 18658 / VKM B-2454 / MOB10) GN=Sinac_5949 PE=4 SV=1: ABC_transp_aux [Gemmataceae bacterium]|nr:ABC-type uncharacterized transporter OS=Singulisphaera acidiphila (strain ATCC BAA-1392 / DSM 18658 / VKM B-2454 / MOB10) GN=Sinac_5949 PE=4 SV=1: ABC_transp_aux [Gemmataceae bacterium]VTU01381.1 ABC-type uncharacterized transporter OS=Singulisphaera acidiphila (strain ATCC BAA-1392 / DSM 18658 / VKM B-2454 / MOB10) GN=Sinac_5949 PE=4 SV=1: ABC_transp_aux [Gemmataceae bacterium]
MTPTQPTPATRPAAPGAGEPLVEFVRTKRGAASGVLGALAVVFLGFAVFFALKAFGTAAAPADKDKAAEKANPDNPLELPKPAGDPANLKRGDFNVGWMSCMLAFLVASLGALWLSARDVRDRTEDQKRTEARLLVLGIGQGLGAVTMLAGLALLYRWSDSFTKWLETSDTDELRWVLIPLMTIITGVGLVFVAIQPARAEERSNATVRRIVYGSNFFLTFLLLVVAFVGFNVVVAAKVSNKLDTTATGFYEISESTKQLLAGLKEPVNAYLITAEEGTRQSTEDMRQLLMTAQDASRGNLRVKFLDAVANRSELRTLVGKYPQLSLTLEKVDVGAALLLTAGEDEKRSAVVPDTEFTTTVDRRPVFQGEPRLFRELVALSNTDGKPVVYFTQSNGELSIDPAAEAPDDRKATRLRAYLEKNYMEVRPLAFPLENPTVPADAAAVVVAGPRSPLAPAAAEALKKYVTDKGKKGRLLVLAGAAPGPNNQGMAKTGLEDLLTTLNVRLGDKFVYSIPQDRRQDFRQTIAGITNVAVAAKNEVAVTMMKVSPAVMLELPREVAAAGPNSDYQPLPLLVTDGITWLEDDRVDEAQIEQVVEQLNNRAVQIRKNVMEGGRPVAALVSQGAAPAGRGAPPTGGTPVAAVYGNAQFVSDAVGRRMSPDAAPLTYKLVGVTLDWLRDRPSVFGSDMEGKKYAEYQFPQASTVDTTRALYFPLALTFLTVVGLGTAVWFVRRK